MIEGATVATVIAGLGIGITLIVLLLRGSFMLGRLSNQVDGLTIAVSELRAEMQRSNQELRAEMQRSNRELLSEVQQSNRTLAALANHTHDTDGRTVFQVPPPASR